MGILGKIRKTVRGKTYPYECGACGHEFESTKPNPNRLTCPECSSGLVNNR